MRLLALTGCRRGKIERLRWDEVDIASGCLRLADSKEGKSVHPLGSAAAKLLANLPKENQFVLPGRSCDRPFSGLPKAWLRILKRANLPDLTPRGLRHAFASTASDLGYTEPTIAAMLGQAAHSTTGRYIHHLDSALIASADRVSARISAVLNAEGKVVSLPRNRRRATP